MNSFNAATLTWLEKVRSDLGQPPLAIKPDAITSSRHPLQGCSLNQAAIGELLGAGSFAVVFELEGASSVGNPLAVKVLPRASGEGALKEQELFLREVKIGQSLRHQTVPQVHSFEERPHSRFVILDRVEGQTLEKLMGQKMSVETYRDIFSQVASGLGHAHKNRVMHRDIKPANIMVEASGAIKILDFGMARLTGSTTVTITGQFKGTPMYCAPEQIVNSKEATEACDQFSFALVSYQALTGQFPYPVVDKQPMLTLFARLQQPAARLSQAWPDAGPAADEAMARMLAQEPEARFPTIEEAFATFSQALSEH